MSPAIPRRSARSWPRCDARASSTARRSPPRCGRGSPEQVATLPFRPGLAVVLVGDDPASAIYVRAKDRAASAVGIAAHTIRLPADTSEEALITQIARLNADPAVDGILVQLAAARAHRLAGGRSRRSIRTRTWTASIR